MVISLLRALILAAEWCLAGPAVSEVSEPLLDRNSPFLGRSGTADGLILKSKRNHLYIVHTSPVSCFCSHFS